MSEAMREKLVNVKSVNQRYNAQSAPATRGRTTLRRLGAAAFVRLEPPEGLELDVEDVLLMGSVEVGDVTVLIDVEVLTPEVEDESEDVEVVALDAASGAGNVEVVTAVVLSVVEDDEDVLVEVAVEDVVDVDEDEDGVAIVTFVIENSGDALPESPKTVKKVRMYPN
ncbi:hypothetical protein SISNIDRAFT_467837 [Sistotremastrum niveocremeum HHB9708]|uniref:Uncharacterized protein n=1 Tax=Sistotremastrum niveocremeum HHB9708 TaxID=1314777 RepID=A0A164S8R5_9AGAM|nr:hypothetical protein SISNIDRAFT_467837 [Sistotremastrum niveocremeum HHB9708]